MYLLFVGTWRYPKRELFTGDQLILSSKISFTKKKFMVTERLPIPARVASRAILPPAREAASVERSRTSGGCGGESEYLQRSGTGFPG